MKENNSGQKIQNSDKKSKLIKEWKNFLIRQEFLKIYLDSFGFKENFTVRHLVDITNFYKQHENEKLQFAIIKINLKTNYIEKEKKLFKKNYRNKNQNLSKNKKLDLIKINEYNNNKKALIEKNNIKILKTNEIYDSSINFLELIFTGILNLQNTKLYKENSIIDKFIKRFNSEYKKLDLNEKLKFEKNDEIFKNDEIKKYHEKLIDDLYKNDLNKNIFNSYEENIVKDNYSLFFGVNGMLVEYISGIDILRIIEKDNVTEGNIGEKIYKHILETNKEEKKISIIYQPVYENNMILFSDNVEKEQILSISNNYLEFFILLLSTVLFLINFMIYQPEKYYYLNKENFQTLYHNSKLDNLLTKEMLKEFILNELPFKFYPSNNTFNYTLINDVNNNNSNNFTYINSINLYNGILINIQTELEKNKIYYFGPKINKKEKNTKNLLYKGTNQYLIPYLNPTKEHQEEIKKKLENELENAVDEVIVTLLLYNAGNNMNLIEKIIFSIDKIGKVNYNRDYFAYKVFLNRGDIYITLVVINIFFLLTLLYDTYRIISMIINRIIDYIKYKIFSFEYGDLVDFTTYIFVLISSIWFYDKVLWNQKKFPVMIHEDDLVYWIKLGFNLKKYQKVTSIALLLLFFKLIRFIYQFLPALDIIFSTFADAFKELFSLFILIVVVLIGMFMMFEGSFGFYSKSYYSFSNSFSSVYMLFVGIFDFDIDFKYINELNSIAIYVWFIFFLIFNLILCNVFLCLIRNAFQEIKDKKQMFNDALFMITKENFIDFSNKIKNLVLCKEPEDVMKEEEEKKQNKILQENILEINKEKLKKEKKEEKEEKKNDDVEIMKKMVNKSWTKIFKYNLSNLNIKSFFRKNVLPLEEFEKKKMNNYNILRKQILKKYIEELKLNASENFDFLIDSFLYIVYLILTVLMVYYQLKLKHLEEVNYFVQNEVIDLNIFCNDNKVDFNKNNFPFYKFNNELRTTSRLYEFKKTIYDKKSIYFDIEPNSNVYTFETNKCKVDFEYSQNINKNGVTYHYLTNISTLDGCGGYFEYKVNNTSMFNQYNNTGLKALDYYLFSEYYDYIIYIRNILYIDINRQIIKENEIYLIPFNRFISYNDFIRIVIEIIYYIFTLYFIYRIVYIIFSLIYEKMYNNYLNDSNRIYFENSPFINKYYRISIQSFKNESGFLLLLEMIFITLFTFIKQTLLLFYFIILSILEYILKNIFNFFDFFSMILTVYLFCLWFIIINKTNAILVNETVPNFFELIENEYDNNLTKVNDLYLLYKNYISVFACNLFLIIIRIIRYLKFSKRIYLVFAIFENEKLTIALYLVFLTVIDLGFVFFGYALFNQNIINFSTVGSGILNIIIMLMGKFHPNNIFNFEEQNNMRSFYIFIFISFNFLVLLNFFYSILIEGYSEVKNFQQKNSSNSRINNDLINIYKIFSVKLEIFMEVCERYKKKIDFYLELFDEQINRYRDVVENLKKEKKEKKEKDDNYNNCFTNIILSNKIYENFYNNVKKISDYCEDINNFTEIELLNNEKEEGKKNLIEEDNEEEEEKQEKKYSYLNALQKKYKNKLTDHVSIYHKIIIYITYLLDYNINFIEKNEEKEKKQKQKELYTIYNEDEEQIFENIEINKWDSLFYPEYKHIIRSLNTKSVLKEFLFDKYFYYIFRINTNFEKFLTNYSNPKDKPNYLTDNRFNVERVPRFSKLTFSQETTIGIEKSDLFMIPSCLSRIHKRIYNTIPFTFNDTNINKNLINDIFTKFAGIEIYDIFIKYFYLPNANNTIDNEIYLGYYLYQTYKKNNQRRTLNLSKEIPKYKIEKFFKKIEYLMNNDANLILKKSNNLDCLMKKSNYNLINNEEQEFDFNKYYNEYKKEFNLYYKYYIWNILYIIIFQTDQNIIREIKNKSESYKIINEYKQKNIKNESMFNYLFTKINKLHEKNENIENDEVLKEKNLPNGYSFTEALISIIRDENLISHQNFNIDNFDKADLLYFENKKYLLENDEKLEEMLLKPKINFYENILKYDTYPTIFLKLWKNRDLDDLFALFYGYNKKINDNSLNNLILLEKNKNEKNEQNENYNNQQNKNENKNNFKEENSILLTEKLLNELKQYNFLEQNDNKLDIYDFFDSENRAEIMLMLEPNSNSSFVKDSFEKLLKKSADNKAEFTNVEKNNKFSELLNHFDIFKINYIKKHDLFNDVFEIHFLEIKNKLLLINNSFNIIFRKFFKENNHILQINDRILINKYIKLIAVKERFIFLYNYFHHKTILDIQNLTLKNKIEIPSEDNEVENKENIYSNINILNNINNKGNNINNNTNLIKSIEMLIKENPFLWILSLDPYDYLDTCQKIRSKSVREFYLELYEFIYGEDETKDEEYYLKKKIKLNFVEKYTKYLEYVKLRDDIEKCQNIIDIRKKELDDNLKYYNERKDEYNRLFNNWNEQKKILNEEINKQEKNLKKDQ